MATEFKIESPEINNIYDSILKGYSYLMINGGVNDSVSGRSISRDNSSEIRKRKRFSKLNNFTFFKSSKRI